MVLPVAPLLLRKYAYQLRFACRTLVFTSFGVEPPAVPCDNCCKLQQSSFFKSQLNISLNFLQKSNLNPFHRRSVVVLEKRFKRVACSDDPLIGLPLRTKFVQVVCQTSCVPSQKMPRQFCGLLATFGVLVVIAACNRHLCHLFLNQRSQCTRLQRQRPTCNILLVIINPETTMYNVVNQALTAWHFQSLHGKHQPEQTADEAQVCDPLVRFQMWNERINELFNAHWTCCRCSRKLANFHWIFGIQIIDFNKTIRVNDLLQHLRQLHGLLHADPVSLVVVATKVIRVSWVPFHDIIRPVDQHQPCEKQRVVADHHEPSV